MRRQRVFAVVVAVCCLFVLTSLSASLESTVSKTPSDVLDLDFASLPLSVEEASELKETYESGPGGRDEETVDTSRSDPERSGPDQSDSFESQGLSGSSADSESESSGSTSDEQSQNEGGTVPDSTDQGLLAMLYDLMGALLAALRASLPVLVLLAITISAVHQRDRLLAWLEPRLERIRTGDGAAADAASDRTFRPPTNRIERAWVELLDESDVDPGSSATPRECAELLVRAGFDGDAVWELTTIFEEVRYDEAPVTADRVQCARRCLRQSTSREVTE